MAYQSQYTGQEVDLAVEKANSIQANPAGSATGQLSKIQLGSTIYSIDKGSVVSVSSTGTATDEVSYITIDGVQKKLAGGSGSAGVSSIGGASGVITLGSGLTMTDHELSATGGSSYTAGAGINISNNEISLANTVNKTSSTQTFKVDTFNVQAEGAIHELIEEDEACYEMTANVSSLEEQVVNSGNSGNINLLSSSASVSHSSDYTLDSSLSATAGETFIKSNSNNMIAISPGATTGSGNGIQVSSSGVSVGSVSYDGQTVSYSAPTSNTHIASKKYVDDQDTLLQSAINTNTSNISKLGRVLGTNSWNQLAPIRSAERTENGITCKIENGKFTASGTCTTSFNVNFSYIDIIAGHKYLLIDYGQNYPISSQHVATVQVYGDNIILFDLQEDSTVNYAFGTATGSGTSVLRHRFQSGESYNLESYFQLFDLTIMGLGDIETINEFYQIFPSQYYVHNSGSYFDLLWVNSSLTSSFADQTINLDLYNYSAVGIIYKRENNTENVYYSQMDIIPKDGLDHAFTMLHTRPTNSVSVARETKVSNTGIEFSKGYTQTIGASTSAVTEDNTKCIPYKIFGIR